MIAIFPWSRTTTDGKPSPKNYPYWPEVVRGLVKTGQEVLQVSCTGEPDVAGARRENDLPLRKIGELMQAADTWISVDNFAHHMAWTLGHSGVVIFGSSDPTIFGHPENINLLKDRRFLRKWQFRLWCQENPNPDIFVGPEAVIRAVSLSISQRKSGRNTGPTR